MSAYSLLVNPISPSSHPTGKSASTDSGHTQAGKTLSTAEVRRESVIVAAMPVFAEKGYHAAPTTEIARDAGISQAYLFRLFPTKEELFIAVIERSNHLMYEAFIEAADRAAAEGLDAMEEMGTAYGNLVGSQRDVLMIQLHGQAMSGYMPAIRETMRTGFAGLYAIAAERTDATPEDLKMWFAGGMLINAMTSISAEEVDEPWAKTLTDFDGDCFNQ